MKRSVMKWMVPGSIILRPENITKSSTGDVEAIGMDWNTDDNKEVKAILRTSTDDAQKKKDALVSDLFPPPHVRLLIAKKKARPVSRLISEPVTVDNSFSDLESENNKEQIARRKILKQ
ncbi:hypothetical protein TNCV_1579521 [Trichonephila clavipes]|nr:hypothetical protein TNCV_1579521 [Trichonephila clavipes]